MTSPCFRIVYMCVCVCVREASVGRECCRTKRKITAGGYPITINRCCWGAATVRLISLRFQDVASKKGMNVQTMERKDTVVTVSFHKRTIRKSDHFYSVRSSKLH